MAEIRQRQTATQRTASAAGGVPPAAAAPAPALANDDKNAKAAQQAKASEASTTLASNITLAVVSALGFITRVWMIHNPGEVVSPLSMSMSTPHATAPHSRFDEVHFGKFGSYYLRREYFFDVHPPLGKLLIALVGLIVGFDGHYLFENIGENYAENNVPYIALRLWCALCGAAIVPTVYLILREMGVSILGAAFGAMLIVVDNALITQSRLILLDSMLMFFCILAIYFWIKFYKQRHEAFSAKWWGWLAMTGVGLSLVLGVKMVGLFTVATIGIATIVDLWELLDVRRGLSLRQFVRHFSARALCLIFLPLVLYLVPFYIHFAILTKSGPGDAFMSLKFQEELIGNANTAGSVAVMFNANVTIKHFESKAFLHSHTHTYPLRYKDERVSSQGQQVNGYAHSDVNSLWTIEAPEVEHYPPAAEYKPTEQETERGVRYVRHGDLVRLHHFTTDSYLLTHDVASPLTPTNMEVTTVKGEAAVKRYNETLWRVEMTDGGDNEKLKSKKRRFRLVNLKHAVAVYSARKELLPDWGFKMQQTNGNKNLADKNNYWVVDKVQHERIVDGVEIGETQEPKEGGKLSFFQKFAELQGLMVHHNAMLTKPHPYSSSPGTWPFVINGISFWEKKDGLKQIYLLGNPVIWWMTIGLVGLYAGLWLVDRVCLRRGVDDFGENARRWWDRAIGFLFIGWLLHWLPFFLMGRMLFLHHYLPAFIFSVMLTAALVDFMGRVVLTRRAAATTATATSYTQWLGSARPSVLQYFVVLVLLAVCVGVFVWFSPLTYGTGFATVEDIRARRWIKTWNLQYS
ncbi:Dolichyl-phosphate-mannose-protein mannosyltransferase-domain-containing protein [Entophlyctis helioformis]|nr:Dolichyl-phosphate-mannose-protein mannosyltransferase-domain-containing protein [Entophlyctis helioformis]